MDFELIGRRTVIVGQSPGIDTWEIKQRKLQLQSAMLDRAEEAFNFLVAQLRDTKEESKVRQKAAVEILNRGLGLPRQAIEFENKGEASIITILASISQQSQQRPPAETNPVLDVLDAQ